MISPIESSINHHRNQLAYDDGKIQIQYGSLQAAVAESAITQLTNIDFGDYIAWSPENDFESFLTFWTLQQRWILSVLQPWPSLPEKEGAKEKLCRYRPCRSCRRSAR